MAADRFNVAHQLEHLQSKHVGTGHADTTRFEWFNNHHRDTYASLVAHPHFLHYIATAENESIERIRARLLEKMIQPIAPELKSTENNKDS